MPATENIFLPLSFNQIFELVNQLPKNQKQQLAKLLIKDNKVAALDVTEVQKKFVRNSIKKYKHQPELLIDEADAWKMINAK